MFGYLKVFFLAFAILTPSIKGHGTTKTLKTSDIIEAIEREDLTSVEAVLRWLSTNSPEFMSDFTLMRSSGSLQGASPSAPRAIVYGKTAELIMSFNGSAAQQGGDRLEFIEFTNDGTEATSWGFREITFDPEGQVSVSSKNPGKCMRCHGSELRPIWEPYDQWPGAYGENDDALPKFSPDIIEASSNPQKLIERNKVRQEFLDFKSKATTHERYQYLQFVKSDESSVAPYIDRTRQGSYPLRPNLRLSKLLGNLNSASLAMSFAKNESCFETAAPAVIAEMIGCEYVDQVTKQYKEKMTSYQKLESEMNERTSSQGSWTRFSSNNKEKFRISLLNLVSIDRHNWQMGIATKGWIYFKGFDNQYDDFLQNAVALGCARGKNWLSYRSLRREKYASYYTNNYEIQEEDDGCQLLSNPAGSYDNDGGGELDEPYDYNSAEEQYNYPTAKEVLCKQIVPEIRPLQELKEKCADAASSPMLIEKKSHDLIGMCESCHGLAGTAPRLDLSDPSKLSATEKQKIWKRLNSDDPNLRMPPDRALSYEEKQRLKAVLDVKP